MGPAFLPGPNNVRTRFLHWKKKGEGWFLGPLPQTWKLRAAAGAWREKGKINGSRAGISHVWLCSAFRELFSFSPPRKRERGKSELAKNSLMTKRIFSLLSLWSPVASLYSPSREWMRREEEQNEFHTHFFPYREKLRRRREIQDPYHVREKERSSERPMI